MKPYLIFLAVYVMLAVSAIDFVSNALSSIDLTSNLRGVIENDINH